MSCPKRSSRGRDPGTGSSGSNDGQRSGCGDRAGGSWSWSRSAFIESSQNEASSIRGLVVVGSAGCAIPLGPEG